MKLYETRILIKGKDAADMTDDEFILVIRNTESDIAELRAIKSKSEQVARKILTLQNGLRKVITYFDERGEK